MKNILFAFAAFTALFTVANTSHALVGEIAPVRMVIEDAKILDAGHNNSFHIKLMTADGKALSPADLKEVHTQKFHMLIVSETLTDYIHAHPVYDAARKDFSVSFTPRENVRYKAWGDITIAADDEQHFLPAVFDGKAACPADCADKTETLTARSEGLVATVKLDGPTKANDAVMADITLTDEQGKPVTDLQPVMGAYAHLVGFEAGLKGVIHAHPMGDEPTSDTERGGPDLGFHIENGGAGYTKFFLQIKRNGKDIYLPFAFTVTE